MKKHCDNCACWDCGGIRCGNNRCHRCKNYNKCIEKCFAIEPKQQEVENGQNCNC
jgi:hypothetical protein